MRSIDTYQDVHGVDSPLAYQSAHAMMIGRLRSRGRDVEVHDDDTPIPARVDDNRWIIDCDCGAGNAVQLDEEGATMARCFMCGAVHTAVVMPRDRAEIERLLIRRPEPSTRCWHPHETVADLAAQNRAKGIR